MQISSNVSVSICILVLISLQCNAFALHNRVAYQATSSRVRNFHMSTPALIAAPIPELRAPKDLFANVVNIGATKAKLTPLKTLLLGIKSGCHISFGKGIQVLEFECAFNLLLPLWKLNGRFPSQVPC